MKTALTVIANAQMIAKARAATCIVSTHNGLYKYCNRRTRKLDCANQQQNQPLADHSRATCSPYCQKLLPKE